ncbi:MAG TPA: hypothetical protein VM056_05355 [Terriglobales bacterium]|nr:hypothetical protein [Terriglobales bacterium]
METIHNFRRTVPERFLQEYLEAVAGAHAFQVSNLKNWDLLRSYAELQYKLNGGGHCGICNAHVRHVIPARVEMADHSVKEYSCLCTRCFEGERATSRKIVLHMGEAAVEYVPREEKSENKPTQSFSMRKAAGHSAGLSGKHSKT